VDGAYLESLTRLASFARVAAKKLTCLLIQFVTEARAGFQHKSPAIDSFRQDLQTMRPDALPKVAVAADTDFFIKFRLIMPLVNSTAD